jgi:hypothetical protein
MVHSETKQDLMVFDNAQDAAGFVEKSAKDIRLVCNKLRQTAGGYAWRWADEKPIELVENIPTYVEEPKKSMTIWIKESVFFKLKDVSKVRGISANKVATKIIEKELKECNIRMDLLNKKYTKKNGFLLECKGIEKVIDFIEK